MINVFTASWHYVFAYHRVIIAIICEHWGFTFDIFIFYLTDVVNSEDIRVHLKHVAIYSTCLFRNKVFSCIIKTLRRHDLINKFSLNRVASRLSNIISTFFNLWVLSYVDFFDCQKQAVVHQTLFLKEWCVSIKLIYQICSILRRYVYQILVMISNIVYQI